MAQKSSSIAFLGPLSDCCAKTGTIEIEEIASFSPDNASRGKTSWLLAPGSLLITVYFRTPPFTFHLSPSACRSSLTSRALP